MSNQIIDDSLEFIDELKLSCPEHKNSIIGVCGDIYCKEKSLYCMRCVKEKKTSCFNNKNNKPHAIESISEVISSFFNSQEKKDFDLVEFNGLLEAVKNIDLEENKIRGLEYFNFAEELYNSVINKVKNCFDEEIDKLKTEFQNELTLIEEKYVKIIREPCKELLEIEFPKSISDQTYRTILRDNANTTDTEKHSEYLEVIDCVKKFNDTEKINTELTNIDTILYLSKLQEIEEIDAKFQKKIDSLENTLNTMLKEVESALFPSKKESLATIKDPCNKFESNPCDLVFSKNICDNAHKSNSIDCVFTCFKSIKDEYVAVWGTPAFNVEAYDLVTNKVVFSKLAHFSTIFTTRHYLDKRNKMDIIITSSYDKSVKLWNFNESCKLILNIANAHTGFYIYSACLLINELDNKTYVISSAPNEYLKLWNMQGKHLNDFGVCNQSTYYVSTWFDSKNKKHYIINANSVDVKVYNFKDLSLFKTYKGTPNTWHMSAYVIERKDKYCLIESDGTGNIRVWDFETANLISTVSSTGINLRGLCIWNDQYVISSGSDHAVKIYDIENMKFVKNLPQHTSTVCSVMKIFIPKLGECLITHALDGKLKLWVNSKTGSKKI